MPFRPLVAPTPALSADESARTARHTALRGFGDEAQRRLAAAHIAIVGAGGLGSPAVLALSAAGVGTLTIIDDDIVDATNLQRQVLHRLSDVGAAKTDSAVRAAADLSPTTVVHAVQTRLDATNAATLLADADIVLDGSDTFATREIVAEACELLGTPLVWGVVQEFHAQLTVFWSMPPAGHAPIVLSDLHPPAQAGNAPSCAEVGVLGTLTMQLGALMATEAIKLVTGIGETLFGRVLLIDALSATHTEVKLYPAEASVAVPEPPATVPTPQIAQIAHVSASEMIVAQQEEKATLLDVREEWETQTGIIAGSVLIPLGGFLDDPEQLDADGPVIVICAHGIRALKAAEALAARGVDARVLAGGLAAWT